MTFVRVVLILVIVSDCVRMQMLGEAPPRPGRSDAVSLGEAVKKRYDPDRFPEVPALWHLNFERLPQHVAVASAALAVHMMLPEAVRELAGKRTQMLPTVSGALIFCMVSYCFVAIAVVTTFGTWTRPICTLNWVNYTAGEPEPGIFAFLVRSMILLVPIFDITSAYPIFARVLASSIHGSLGKSSDLEPPFLLCGFCAVLPLVGAAIVFDVAETLGWAGVLLMPLIFMVPQLMMLKGEEYASNAWVQTLFIQVFTGGGIANVL
eukprot:CAMPEP_0172918126 /NCGR_PEP_ID=MMETSP1075-20121228/199538_1 /TAXON_ID=2916 /ORGANISM="Ceratium fusus, Strain PA161109" /LENGTH=263 /DNA_ID=CAMNT_0013777713 /DNA_START=102 /DNA_END=890 /DNA_ORIENTATION=-